MHGHHLCYSPYKLPSIRAPRCRASLLDANRAPASLSLSLYLLLIKPCRKLPTSNFELLNPGMTVHPGLDRLKTRIQGLRSKTTDNGCTEAEALLAATKVAELLDRYDLSLTDVEI